MNQSWQHASLSWTSRFARTARNLRFFLVLGLLSGALSIAVLQGSSRSERPIGDIAKIDYAAGQDIVTATDDPRIAFRNARQSIGIETLNPLGPAWLRISALLPQTAELKTVELRLLRSETGTFWIYRKPDFDARTAIEPLAISPSRTAKGGIAFDVPADVSGEVVILGRVSADTVARVKGSVWISSSFQKSQLEFERTGGALGGTLLVLAVFAAIIALLNRDRTYWLFAGWLITTYRVAAVNEGWDLTWLNIDLPTTWHFVVIRFTLAAHAFLTVELFTALFSKELRQGSQHTLTVLRVITVAQLPAAVLLPHTAFLPYFWTSTGLGLSILLFLLARILIHHPSRTAIWYSVSWAATFGGSLAEVAFISGLVNAPFRGLNVQVGAVASALIIAVTLAERLRTERLARKKAQRRAIEALKKFRNNYNSIPVGLFSLDINGRLEQTNPAFGRVKDLHRSIRGFEPCRWDDVFGSGAFADLRERLKSSEAVQYEFTTKATDDSEKVYLLQASKRKNEIDGFINDITERKAAETRLQHLADHDPLTDLSNRRALERELAMCVASVERGSRAALAYIDLDRFKLVNDLFGHVAGDHVLRQIAARLKAALGPKHLLSRVGGDEFVVILYDCELAEAGRICKGLLSAVGDMPIQFADKAFSVTAGIGVVALTPGLTPKDAIAACDRACGDAKRLGGSHLVTYAEHGEELKRHLEEIRLVAVMRDHLPTERLFFQLQPIVSLQAAFSSLNYEVLTRMKDEDGSVISPGKFIAAAERNGAMAKIDRWVLASTLDWLAANPRHLEHLGFATVNLSGASLNDERFVEDSIALVRSFGPLAERLCFEITETVALYDLRNTRKFVDRIKSLGALVALDDFGAGYTSFNYLKQLPADIVKIDGEFIRSIDRQESNLAITRAIVDLCHHIGMRVVAEWAETPSVIETLMRIGVDYGQGYGLVRPLDGLKVLPALSGGSLVEDPLVLSLLRSPPPASLAKARPSRATALAVLDRS